MIKKIITTVALLGIITAMPSALSLNKEKSHVLLANNSNTVTKENNKKLYDIDWWGHRVHLIVNIITQQGKVLAKEYCYGYQGDYTGLRNGYEPKGYELVGISVNGKIISKKAEKTFTVPQYLGSKNEVINYIVKPIIYKVNIHIVGNNNLNIDKIIKGPVGTDIKISDIPKGYQITKVSVNGKKQSGINIPNKIGYENLNIIINVKNLDIKPEVKPDKPIIIKPVKPDIKPEVHPVKPDKPVVHPVKPEVKPDKPVVHPVKPEVKPDKPVVHPEKPEVKPDKPVVHPEKPKEKPDKPVVHPEKPKEKPDKPVVHPEKPEVKPDKPIVHPEKPEVKPDKPIVHPVKPEVKPDKPIVHQVKPEVKPDKPIVHPVKPDVKSDKPVVHPEKPEVKPDKPIVHPVKPEVKPDKPIVHPEKPEVKPDKPIVHQVKPEVKPDKPIVHPVKPDVKSDKPVVHPEKPKEKPDKPIVHPEKPKEKPDKPIVHSVKPDVKPDKPIVHPIIPKKQIKNDSIVDKIESSIKSVEALASKGDKITGGIIAIQPDKNSLYLNNEKHKINNQDKNTNTSEEQTVHKAISEVFEFKNPAINLGPIDELNEKQKEIQLRELKQANRINEIKKDGLLVITALASILGAITLMGRPKK